MLVLDKEAEVETDIILLEEVQTMATSTGSMRHAQSSMPESAQAGSSAGNIDICEREQIPVPAAAMLEYALMTQNFKKIVQ